jgi:hypothetical protein
MKDPAPGCLNIVPPRHIAAQEWFQDNALSQAWAVNNTKSAINIAVNSERRKPK